MASGRLRILPLAFWDVSDQVCNISRYVKTMRLEDIVNSQKTLTTAQLTADGELMRQIQTQLANCRFYPSNQIDGIFGAKTSFALTEFCKSVWLNNATTGLWGATFAKELLVSVPPASKSITQQDYQMAATRLGVEVATIKAVVEVECNGSGFFKDGRTKILFEAHHFDRYTKGQFRQSHPNISSPTWNRKLYFGGVREYARFDEAKSLNAWAAMMSVSWGLGQIMGFNHVLCGYKTVESFVADMAISEGKQLMAMCEFIRNRGLVTALKKHEWNTFAYAYNGEGYRANAYHLKLASAYNKYRS